MRDPVRGAVFGLLLAAAGVPALAAQDAGAARLEIALTPDTTPTGRRFPIVRAVNLLGDTPWLDALRQGLPVRLRYRLELWRSRDAWLDALEQQYEWNVLVRHEPLLDQFTLIQLHRRGRVARRLGTAGALAEALGVWYDIRLAPTAPGQYYYVASLEVSALAESDLDEIERVFRGELQAVGEGGGSLSRSARRLVLRLAGLPTLKLSARSEGFTVR